VRTECGAAAINNRKPDYFRQVDESEGEKGKEKEKKGTEEERGNKFERKVCVCIESDMLIERNAFLGSRCIGRCTPLSRQFCSFLYRSRADDRDAIGAKWVGQSRCSLSGSDDARSYSVSDPQPLVSTTGSTKHLYAYCPA
jgi:hypothetical protein